MISRGLPGLRFDSTAAPEVRVLPRMDVVGFVGLAAAGPVDVPVPIENTGQFLAIFGEDLRIDPGAGGRRRSFLGAAVRAFFANGGRRCVVVRTNGSEATRFPLPGVAASPIAGEPAPQLIARSPGSWADGLTVATRAERTSLRLDAPTLVNDALGVRVEAAVHADDPVQAGDLLAWREGPDRIFAPVETVVATGLGGRDRWIRTGLGTRVAAGVVSQAWFAAALPIPQVAGVATVEVWTFTIFTRTLDQRVHQCVGLGFHPSHPRYWRRLPDDATFFAAGFVPTPLDVEVARPRFPVAATPGAGWEVPGSMPADELERLWVGGTLVGTAWERDGLARFEPGLLLDEALADRGLETLPALADDLRYLRPNPRALRGVHALWEVEEVTLISTPDLVQPPWAITGAAATPTIEIEPQARGFFPCGPGSLTIPEWDGMPAPAPGATTVLLSWDGAFPATALARQWRLERASRPDFADAQTVSMSGEQSLLVATAQPLEAWFRVRAEAGARTSGWSNPLHLRVPVGPTLADHPAPTDPAVVQRAVLRMCAARGDLVALFSAPDRDWQELRAHAASIRARSEVVPTPIGTLSGTDRRALSHGALYGPWLLVREVDGELRAIPPDGAIAGTLAKRAAEAGAWMAPANLPLHDLISPTRHPGDADALALLQAQVIPIRREPWGTVALGEYLLSDDEMEVQHLHVRRLLALLRRLALRHGNEWVFEPNSPAFARAVHAAFDAVLRHLYTRGAFAGDRPASAYDIRVMQDPREIERGRFIVELRVAPVEPLRFLTVRLVQDDARGVAAEGA